MPVLREFDTQSVRPWYKPTTDTHAILKFPRPFVAPPRLPHGFRQLDISCNANIRVKSTVTDATQSCFDCHITTWSDSTVHGGVAHVFALAPGDLEFLTGEHMRTRHDPTESVRVKFERPFITPPKVVVFFNYIDLGKGCNWRLRTIATDIDVEGFTLKIETWSNTVFYAAQVCWVAYPEDREHIYSASFNTLDIRPPSPPRSTSSKKIKFEDVEFWKDPEVFVALNSIDINCKNNLRIDAYVDGVTRTGLVLHIDSWEDSILHSAGATIIAFN